MQVELKTLQDAMEHFADSKNAVAYMVRLRWTDGVVKCPTCDSEAVTWMPTRSVWQCKARHSKHQFSVKVGTIFEDSAIGLGKWLLIGWMLANCRNGISSYEVARTIGITQKSAWFMLHRIREAARNDSPEMLSGVVEADETYIGGKIKNKHLHKRKQGYQKDKIPIVGMVARGGRVIAAVVPTTKDTNVVPLIEASIDKSATVYTDNYPIYDKLRHRGFTHEVINHVQDRFVRGSVHTNTIENFWSVLKRTLSGTYISVRPQHLQSYVVEQAFRFNSRKGLLYSEEQRFSMLLEGTTGKRLTYARLTART